MNIEKLYILTFFAITLGLSACQSASGEKTGSEYMPDMAHSIAYEANVYSYYAPNRWGTPQELYAMSQPRVPVKGTIARGYIGDVDFTGQNSRGIAYTPNGHVNYYYPNTEEGRTAAIAEIKGNPFPITEAGINKGKELYNIQCAICHGDKGDGAGYLVRDDGGKYPVQPANLLQEQFVNSGNGLFYHAIVNGRNLMGSYADKLSYEERWQVIHYIRSMQAASVKKVYNEKENTFTTFDIPAASIQKSVVEVAKVDAMKDTIVVHTVEKAHH
ncbi:MAG: c-type cytochrome [Saprospiraceae bacterium]